MNERGQYSQAPQRAALAPLPSPPSLSPPLHALPSHAPSMPWDTWTGAQRRELTRSLALGTLGSITGAVAWKNHRVWGFLLGGLAGHAIGNLVFAPPAL